MAVKPKTYKIGITGSICSGKSLVCNILKNYGLSVIDASDMLYTIASSNPALVRQMNKHFETPVTDRSGHISKKKLKEQIVASPLDKHFVDEVVNPIIREEIKHFLYGPLGTYIRIVESPQLFETKSTHLFDEIWTVYADPETCIKRLVQRDQIRPEEAHLRLISEIPIDEKVELSHRVIDNNADRASTEKAVRKIYEDVKNKAFTSKL